MATVTTSSVELSPAMIHQAAIPLRDQRGVERLYAYDPHFAGKCYFQCFYCHVPLYREPFAQNTHDKKCSQFPEERDQKVMISDAWKVVTVYGTSAPPEDKKFQIVKKAFERSIPSLDASQ